MWALLALFAITWLIYYWWTLRPPNFPPGPPCVPLLGSVPFIKLQRIHLFLEKARVKYGPIIGLKLGMINAVFICGAPEVLETFKMDSLQGRPKGATLASSKATKGIILTEGAFWSTQRRFTLRHLRDFGFGKSSTEGVILEEIEDFFQQTLYKNDQIQISNLFNTSAINVLWRMMAGKRYQHDDKEFAVLLQALRDTFRQGGFTTGFLFLRRYFRSLVGIPEKIECEETLVNFIQNSIDEHKRTKSDEEESRDFIDVYLREIQAAQDPDLTELSLVSICLDLFSAGAESVGNTLGFCVLYLVLYPEIQQDVWQEVDQVLGGANPTLTDRSRLPKVEALLSEVARFNTIAPLPVPRRAMEATPYKGYVIPKNTFVVISIWSLLRDKEHWGDPDVFRPARFLDQDGRYKKDDWLLNFGYGKRQCPGESLAKNVMFLFLLKLIQEFEFGLPAGAERPSELGLPGFTAAPQPFEATLKRRLIK